MIHNSRVDRETICAVHRASRGGSTVELEFTTAFRETRGNFLYKRCENIISQRSRVNYMMQRKVKILSRNVEMET